MIRLLIPVVLLLLGLGGGVGAGLLLSNPPPADIVAETESTPEVIDDPSGPSPSGLTEFVRLNNQFVVPIVRNGTVRSLVVMSLTLEVDLGNNQTVFSQEPRLRDSFLQVMFAHANAGGFDGSFTQAVTMAPLRAALRDAARQALGAIAHDVLIVDITRQDA
jgi:hypothetical protein